MTIAVIDAGSGNLRSAAKALVWAAEQAGLSANVVVTAEPKDVLAATHIVLPGQGEFGQCRRGIAEIAGMEDSLAEAVIEGGRPFFGICVGMQLLADQGHENGVTQGFGWVGGQCVALHPPSPAIKIPHMGWNDLTITQGGHPVLRGVETGEHAYFVHSYWVDQVAPEHVLATSEHGQAVTAIVGRNNIVGTQFHAEKSQMTGLKLLTNFLKWRP
jgi:glutamine amidotransferase